MNRHQMLSKINSINDLPTLPTIAMEVNRLVQDIDTPIEELIDLLEKDQSMVLKILRLVNSSFYGFKSRITSLRHAVTLLGYSTVQHAVVTVAIIDLMRTKATLKGYDIVRFWNHSIGTAVLCRHLATMAKCAIPEEAFTAGLIHDIGKIVIANFFPDIFLTLVETTEAEKITFCDSEKVNDTYPHNLIGANLARRWMLPESLSTATRFHHNPNYEGNDSAIVGIVGLASTLTNLMDKLPGYRLNLEELPETIRTPVTNLLKNSETWFPRLRQDIHSACEFFSKE